MDTRMLLGGSAAVMGVAGLAATFLPHEILVALGLAPDAPQALMVQLLGALWFAFAMMNWTAKGSAIGGIYGRPVALGNLTHFVVGGLALAKAVSGGRTSAVVMGMALVYLLFALAFAFVFLRGPVPSTGAPGRP